MAWEAACAFTGARPAASRVVLTCTAAIITIFALVLSLLVLERVRRADVAAVRTLRTLECAAAARDTATLGAYVGIEMTLGTRLTLPWASTTTAAVVKPCRARVVAILARGLCAVLVKFTSRAVLASNKLASVLVVFARCAIIAAMLPCNEFFGARAAADACASTSS